MALSINLGHIPYSSAKCVLYIYSVLLCVLTCMCLIYLLDIITRATIVILNVSLVYVLDKCAIYSWMEGIHITSSFRLRTFLLQITRTQLSTEHILFMLQI